MLPWIGLGSHFYCWAFPGHVNAQGGASVFDLHGSKGARRPVHGVCIFCRLAGLTEPLEGMEAFRKSEVLRGIEALGGNEGSWKMEDLEGLKALRGNRGSLKVLAFQGMKVLRNGEALRERVGGLRFSEGWRLSEEIKALGRSRLSEGCRFLETGRLSEGGRHLEGRQLSKGGRFSES